MGKIQVLKEGISEVETMTINEDPDSLMNGKVITDPKNDCWEIIDCNREKKPVVFRIRPTQRVQHRASNGTEKPH